MKLPEKEAEEIIEFFLPKMYCYCGSGMLSDNYDRDVALSFAKECALFHVRKLINLNIKLHGREIENNLNNIDYYYNVEKYIKNYENIRDSR